MNPFVKIREMPNSFEFGISLIYLMLLTAFFLLQFLRNFQPYRLRVYPDSF